LIHSARGFIVYHGCHKLDTDLTVISTPLCACTCRLKRASHAHRPHVQLLQHAAMLDGSSQRRKVELIIDAADTI
jgi:hypothetical protein